MKYLVTGGAGFIGSHLVDTLAVDNQVIVIDNLSSGSSNNLKISNNVLFVKGDIRDNTLLEKLCKDVHGIFHLAAFTSVAESFENPLLANDINILGTLSVLKAAAKFKINKVVLASSAAVYGNDETLPKHELQVPAPLSPYAVSKLMCEYYCKIFSENFNVPCVALRYFNVFGPRQRIDSAYSAVIPKFI